MRGNICANICVLIMILAAFIPLIVQLSSSFSPYPSDNQVSGYATGLFWQNSDTTTTIYEINGWNSTVGDNFTSMEQITCEVPIMNEYQGNMLKTMNESEDVTSDEFFVGW